MTSLENDDIQDRENISQEKDILICPQPPFSDGMDTFILSLLNEEQSRHGPAHRAIDDLFPSPQQDNTPENSTFPSKATSVFMLGGNACNEPTSVSSADSSHINCMRTNFQAPSSVQLEIPSPQLSKALKFIQELEFNSPPSAVDGRQDSAGSKQNALETVPHLLVDSCEMAESAGDENVNSTVDLDIQSSSEQLDGSSNAESLNNSNLRNEDIVRSVDTWERVSNCHIIRSIFHVPDDRAPIARAIADSAKSVGQGKKRRYFCSTCAKAFKIRDALFAHVVQHTGEMPYKCPVENCQKMFMWRGSIQYHCTAHVTKGDLFKIEGKGWVTKNELLRSAVETDISAEHAEDQA